MLSEICASEDAHGAMQAWLAERLTPEQQSQVSAAAVGPLIEDADHARVLVADYIAALERRRRQREVEELRRAAAQASMDKGGEDEAAAAAQALISLRRASDPRR